MSIATQPANTTNGTKMSKPNKPGRPWWRPLVDGIDRKVTPPANNLVRTNVFADTVATMTRLEVRLRRRIERQSSWLLHQYNLPTAGDVRKMRAQLAAIEARLRDMSERIEDQQLEARRDRAARTRTTRVTAAAKSDDGSN
jgi:hypothetical protein